MSILRFLALSIPVLASLPLTAETPDTIKVFSNVSAVTVSRSTNTTVIRAIVPDEGNAEKGQVYTYTVTEESPEISQALESMTEESILRLPFTNRIRASKSDSFKPSHYITCLRYIYWGWNFNYDSKVGIKNSFETGITDLIGVEWATSNHTRLGVGIGFGMQRVTTSSCQLFVTEDDRLTTTTPPEGSEPGFARLDNMRFHVPVYWRQRLAGSFGFSLSAIANFNTYSSATNCYRLGRTRYKQTIHGLNQRLLTVDLMATVGFVDCLGVYVKWSPVSVMQDIYGPAFRTLSLGINVNF